MSRIYKLDIGTIGTPVNGGGYVDVTEYTIGNGGKLVESLVDNEIFERTTRDGSISFFGSVYDDIISLITADEYRVLIKIYEDTTELYNSYVNIRGFVNTDEKEVTCSIGTNDAYDNILNNADKQLNIIQCDPKIENTVNLEFEFEDKSCCEELFNPPFVGSSHDNMVVFLQNNPTYDRSGSTVNCNGCGSGTAENIENQGWQEYATTITKIPVGSVGDPIDDVAVITWQTQFKRRVQWTADIAGEKNPPAGWVDLDESKTVNGIVYHKYADEAYPGYSTYQLSSLSSNIALRSLITVGYVADIIVYSRNRKLYDVVSYMMSQIDSTIQIENNVTPSTTDSYYWLKTKSVGGENPYKWLLMAGLSDTVPATGGAEKDTPATKCEMSFSELVTELKDRFKLYWLIENRSGVNYLVFKHLSELSYTSGVGDEYDFTILEGVNWSEADNVYQYDETGKYYKVQRNTIAFNADHIGQDIEITPLENIIKNKVEISLNKFYTDIDAIYNFGDSYAGSSTNQFVWFACDRSLDATTIATFSNSGYDSVTYSSVTRIINLQAVTTAATSTATSATVDYGFGRLLTFVINVTTNTGTMPFFRVYDGGQPYDYTLSLGANTIEHTTVSNSTYFQFLNGSGQIVNFIAQITLYEEVFTTRKATGLLSGFELNNNDISIANLDINAWLWDMPASTAVVNGATVSIPAAQRMNDKLVEFRVPIYETNKIDFNKLILADIGLIRPKTIVIDEDYDFATVTAWIRS